MQENNMLFNDQPVSYRIIGQGQPVMLVHGFGEDSTVWEHQVNALKDRYQLIIPDLPGSGQSAAGDIAQWSMDYFAACLHAIIEHEQIDRLTMIGHSMGGYITLAFAERYADKLQAFGLFHSTAYADNEEKIAARRRGIEFVQQNGARKFLEQSIPNLFAEPTKKTRPALVQEALSRYTYFMPAAVIGYYESMIRRPDRTAVLKSFPRPVLFIIGKYDTAVLPEQTLQQTWLPHTSFVKIYEDAGHMGMWERAADAGKDLTDFLELVHL